MSAHRGLNQGTLYLYSLSLATNWVRQPSKIVGDEHDGGTIVEKLFTSC